MGDDDLETLTRSKAGVRRESYSGLQLTDV